MCVCVCVCELEGAGVVWCAVCSVVNGTVSNCTVSKLYCTVPGGLSIYLEHGWHSKDLYFSPPVVC